MWGEGKGGTSLSSLSHAFTRSVRHPITYELLYQSNTHKHLMLRYVWRRQTYEFTFAHILNFNKVVKVTSCNQPTKHLSRYSSQPASQPFCRLWVSLWLLLHRATQTVAAAVAGGTVALFLSPELWFDVTLMMMMNSGFEAAKLLIDIDWGLIHKSRYFYILHNREGGISSLSSQV